MDEALLRELAEREAIKELKARYFRLLDTRDWAGWRAVFTDDVRVTLPTGSVTGADAFVAEVRATLEGARTVHHGHMPELTIDSATEAHGIWALNDYVEWDPDPETGERRGIEGFAHYHESYRKLDGGWRIASLDLRYLRIDPLRGPPLPAAAS
jgi:ketosteroid isomerase-like protein